MSAFNKENLESLISDMDYFTNQIHDFHSLLEEGKRDLRENASLLDEWQAEDQKTLISQAETLLVRIAEQVSKATKAFKSQSFIDQSGRIISKDYLYQENAKQETHMTKEKLLKYYADIIQEKGIDLKKIYTIQQFLIALGSNQKTRELTSAKRFVINFIINSFHK